VLSPYIQILHCGIDFDEKIEVMEQTTFSGAADLDAFYLTSTMLCEAQMWRLDTKSFIF